VRTCFYSTTAGARIAPRRQVVLGCRRASPLTSIPSTSLNSCAGRLKAMPGFALPYDLILSEDRECRAVATIASIALF
jgi:hypothetical protein